MTRILVVHPYLRAVGGSNLVAAWTIQALRDEAVSLATLADVDLPAVNRSFGTSLRRSDVVVRIAPPRYRRVLRAIRTPGALLDSQLTVRWAQNLDRTGQFDVLYSTHNEADVGRRAIQYVNLPQSYLPDAVARQRWSHRVPGLHGTFRALCFAVGRSSRHGVLRNVFIADSDHIARRIRSTYGAESVTIYPPVPAVFPRVSWNDRRAGFVGVGRIASAKRWQDAVAIVDALRARGHGLSLTLLGHRDDDVYRRQLVHLAASRPWFRIVHDLDRAALNTAIASHRYGIHTMHDEHFGLGPAELLSAGCLPFVHNSGGPAEIVPHPALTFDSVAQAVERIDAVLNAPLWEHELLAHCAARADRFTADRFCGQVRDVVRAFAGHPADNRGDPHVIQNAGTPVQ